MLELQLVWGDRAQPLELEDGEHTVGRAGDNAIQIPVGRVSKHHAVVRVQANQLFVRDLGSTNGTELDGERIGKDEVEVPINSSIRFGGAVLKRSMPMTSQVSHTIATNADVNTLFKYNPSEGFSAAARDRIVDVSSQLFELLASGQNVKEVGTATCHFVAQCVQADRIVLLEDQGEATTLEMRSRWTKSGDDSAPLHMSSTIVGQVLSQRDSVLVANPLNDPKYTGQESIVALHLRSAMAAPLFDNERVRGILYVDTADPMVQYTHDDLQVLTATANAVAVKLRNITYEKEMRTAALIQRGILPSVLEPPEGFELDAHQVMCRAVGGDLYHCLERPDGKTLLALGDVAGKGIPAALAMGAATVLIGMLAEIGGDIEQIAKHMNHQLYQSLTSEQFITLFLVELDEKTGHIGYVNAGHEPALLFHPDGSYDELGSTGLPIALMEDVPQGSGESAMQPGDLLAIFSDGIPEATTDGERFLGVEAVIEILAEHRDLKLSELRKRIEAAVKDFLAGGHSSDDVTLILLRRNPS